MELKHGARKREKLAEGLGKIIGRECPELLHWPQLTSSSRFLYLLSSRLWSPGSKLRPSSSIGLQQDNESEMANSFGLKP